MVDGRNRNELRCLESRQFSYSAKCARCNSLVKQEVEDKGDKSQIKAFCVNLTGR